MSLITSVAQSDVLGFIFTQVHNEISSSSAQQQDLQSENSRLKAENSRLSVQLKQIEANLDSKNRDLETRLRLKGCCHCVPS